MMANAMPGSTVATASVNGNGHSHAPTGFWALTIGSIGVVYGDIGTSPLYAFREAMRASAQVGGATSVEAVLQAITTRSGACASISSPIRGTARAMTWSSLRLPYGKNASSAT